MQLEVESGVEPAQREEVGCVSRNLIKETDMNEMFSQSLSCWSQSDTFTQAFFGKVVNKQSCISPGAAFSRQCVTGAIKEDLKQHLHMAKKTLSSSDFSLSASTVPRQTKAPGLDAPVASFATRKTWNYKKEWKSCVECAGKFTN